MMKRLGLWLILQLSFGMVCALRCEQVSSISQYGITWEFDKAYESGQYANGDYWVLGPVTITRITPDYQQYDFWEYTPSKTKGVVFHWINGWQVNPSCTGMQGFDETNFAFDSTLVPALPYVSKPGESIVKAVSGTDPKVLANYAPSDKRMIGQSPLLTAAVLTVVGSIPPDDGKTVFRPPYVDTDKKLYSTKNLKTSLLPSLAPVAEMPTLESMYEQFRRVQLDHAYYNQSGVVGSIMRPQLNMRSSYQPHNSVRNNEGALRLLMNDPPSAKMPLLIAYVQYGIDIYHFILGGQRWGAGYGMQNGVKLPLTFAATLLDDPNMKQAVGAATYMTEHWFLNKTSPDKPVLWGAPVDEHHFWSVIINQLVNFEDADPYGYIDGGMNGYNMSGAYQNCCLSQNYKGAALVGYLMPELGKNWQQPEFFEYADRWSQYGVIAQPDACAPAEGVWKGGAKDGQRCTTAQDLPGDAPECKIDLSKYGVTYGPDVVGGHGNCYLTQTCTCIKDTDPSDGIGRFPNRDHIFADQGFYTSPYVVNMWSQYRHKVPVAAPIISPAGGKFLGYVDVEMRAATYGTEIRYTIDGTEPTATSLLYAAPFRLTKSTKIRARSYHKSIESSPTSTEANLVIAVDNVIPELRQIVTLDDPKKIALHFTEALQKTSAEFSGNYTMDKGVTVISAQLENENTVTLMTSPMTEGESYSLGISRVADLAGNSVNPSMRHEFIFSNLDPGDGLVGFWNFNSDHGNLAIDSSPDHYDGTISSATHMTGMMGTGLAFKNGDSVNFEDNLHSFNIDAGNRFTLSFWMKATGHNQAVDVLVGRGLTYSVQLKSDGKIRSQIWGADDLTSSLTLEDNRWYFIALTYDETGRTLYIDGVKDEGGSADATAANLYFTNTVKTQMGGTFSGMLDEVRLYNRALSVTQVRALQNINSVVAADPDPQTVSSSGSSSPVETNGVFNPTRGEKLNLTFFQPSGGHVTAQLFSRDGAFITELMNADQPAGNVFITWDGKIPGGGTASAGTYGVVVKRADGTERIKVVLVK